MYAGDGEPIEETAEDIARSVLDGILRQVAGGFCIISFYYNNRQALFAFKVWSIIFCIVQTKSLCT